VTWVVGYLLIGLFWAVFVSKLASRPEKDSLPIFLVVVVGWLPITARAAVKMWRERR